MNRRLPLIIACCLMPAATAWAGPVERGLEARWRGAWVIVKAEVRSNCSGSYTNNRVNGRLVQSGAGLVFPEGELAQVKNLDVKRSRVDVLLDLYEPRLVAHQDGPFTLYDRARCRVELEIEVPREMVKKRRVDAIDAVMLEIMEREESLQQAQSASAWNRRACEEFPEGYEQTLRQYEVWKAEQYNAEVDERRAEVSEQLQRIAEGLLSDPDYLAGFAAGIERAREHRQTQDCAGLLRERLAAPKKEAPAGGVSDRAGAKSLWERGFADGYLLLRGLRRQRSLPGCYRPVPQSA